ncbi:MAG: hypothetical protein MHM6MM_006427 [Cercozoa sp. M6MM]
MPGSGPTDYGEQATAAWVGVDVLTIQYLVAAGVAGVSLLPLIPLLFTRKKVKDKTSISLPPLETAAASTRVHARRKSMQETRLVAKAAHRRRLRWLFTLSLAWVAAGAALFGAIFSRSWRTAVTATPQELPMAAYRTEHSATGLANIGIHAGLGSVNLTLVSAPESPLEFVYNEEIPLHEGDWRQGRLGFGSEYAAAPNIMLRRWQNRGMPLPLQWIADNLVVDGDGIRFARRLRDTRRFFVCVPPSLPGASALFAAGARGAKLVVSGLAVCALLAVLLHVILLSDVVQGTFRKEAAFIVPFNNIRLRPDIGASVPIVSSVAGLSALAAVLLHLSDIVQRRRELLLRWLRLRALFLEQERVPKIPQRAETLDAACIDFFDVADADIYSNTSDDVQAAQQMRRELLRARGDINTGAIDRSSGRCDADLDEQLAALCAHLLYLRRPFIVPSAHLYGGLYNLSTF